MTGEVVPAIPCRSAQQACDLSNVWFHWVLIAMPISKTHSFIAGAAGALFILVAAAIIVPQYGDFRARAQAADALVSIRPTQDRVAAQAIARQSLVGSGLGIAQSASGHISESWVLTDGAIVLRLAGTGQVFVLLPTYSAGAVSWRCIGGSAKNVPLNCRS